VIIDGYVVYEGGGSHSKLLSLGAGEHIVEVEYINNWHTTSFALEIGKETRIFGQTHIKEQLAGELPEKHDVYHATVYESSTKDLSLMVKIEKSRRPIVLRLSSYSAVAWEIYNPHNTEILAIVYGAYAPGSSISGDIAESVLRYPAYGRLQGANYKRSSHQCRCSADGNRCEMFKGRYSAEALDFPACR